MRAQIRAQIFYIDAFVGILIFMLAAILYFTLAGNLSPQEGKVLDALVSDAVAISSSLLAAGSPGSWTQDNVSSIGLTDGSHRLNATKVAMFMNMSYNVTNNMFGTNANYLVFFEDKSGNVLFFDRCLFSNTGFSVQNISAYLCENFTIQNQTHLASSGRLVTYNSEIIKLIVYVWV